MFLMPVTMNSRYQATRFLTSTHGLIHLPPDRGREVAVAGRSNAGKSSALNAIAYQKSLARTSKTPGRTQMMNYFQIEPGRCLVDLPGYGYAEVSEQTRHRWRHALEHYLGRRAALRGLLLLMDIRHPLTDLDRTVLNLCEQRQLPGHVLLSKADKLKRGSALAVLQQVQRDLQQHYRHVSVQLFSAFARVGIDEVHAKLDLWLGYADQTQQELG